MSNIKWYDLEKRTELFTKRNSMMVDLDTNKPIMHYGVNTKIRFVQIANFNNELYFRTESAKQKNLNWAVKVSSFDWPIENAPSELLTPFTSHTLSTKVSADNLKSKRKTKSETNKGKSHNDGGGSVKKLFKKLFKKGK